MKKTIIVFIVSLIVFCATSFSPIPKSSSGYTAMEIMVWISIISMFVTGFRIVCRLDNMSASNKKDMKNRFLDMF